MTVERNASSIAVPGSEARSVLVGDRLCASCGFNLVGQSIVREPHYGMIMVRCPECGSAAALQEYPLLGRWASRWTRVLIVAWFFVLFAVTMATAGSLFGISIAASEMSYWPFSEFVLKRYNEWYLVQPVVPAPAGVSVASSIASPSSVDPLSSGIAVPAPDPAAAAAPDAAAPTTARAAPAAPPAKQPANQWETLDPEWIKAHPVGALLREAGGFWGIADGAFLRLWVIVAIIAALWGLVWSVLLLGTPRWKLPLVVVPLAFAVASIFVAIQWSDTHRWITAQNIASQSVGIWALVMTLLFSAVPLSAGLLVGRSIARLLVRILLPPRPRASLADLWLCDGLKPPRPDRSR